MRILVVGTGYVGLVTGACFAEMGHIVICLDIDKKKILNLKQGIVPFFEPGLEEIVKRNMKAGRLFFTTEYPEAVKESEICFIAVSTPASSEGAADITYVKQAALSIAEEMDGYKIIVNKSTVPVGTAALITKEIEQVLNKRGKECQFSVVSNPEFLKEGDAIADFMKPDRIVIGALCKKAKEVMQDLYAPFNLSSDRLLVMDPVSAEMTKYASNAMLASRISFINEIAGLCECLGADIRMVRKGIGTDKRIGSAFLYPGVGYGGSCFPKDIKALKAMAEEQDYEMPLLAAIEEVNERQKLVMAKKMVNYFADRGDMEGKKIAIWGLAFKPGTDDVREAPSLTLIRALLKEGAFLTLFDPVAMKNVKEGLKLSPQIQFASDEYEAAKGAHAIVLMTEWKQFRSVDFVKIRKTMKGKGFFDGRNQYSPSEMKELGFDYFYIGGSTEEMTISMAAGIDNVRSYKA